MVIKNPRRQQKKITMVLLNLKTGKQYRKWEKKEKRKGKNIEGANIK